MPNAGDAAWLMGIVQAASRAMTDVAPTFVYRTVGADGIDAVRPLWEKLRAYHAPLLNERPPFLFEPRKRGIVDWRFRDEDSGTAGSIYTWTNQFAPQTDDPVLQDIFKVRVDQARRHNESGK